MTQNEPGCLESPDEPGWMAGIGPELQVERGCMGFGARIKDLFSTSAKMGIYKFVVHRGIEGN